MTQPIHALAEEIDTEIRALPNGDTASIRAVRRQFSKRLAKATPAQVIQLALQLRDKYRWVAYELVQHHPKAMQKIGALELRLFGQGMASWDAVDTFGTFLSGPAWREGQVSDEVIHEWARSDNRWWRRAALVSTVALNIKARGGTGDVPRTLAVCRLLANDHDDMVEKALSWALRALVQHDPQAVREFLAAHNDVLGARVKREVRNKLKTGLKNPRKK
jgi:3-methyladenine DNA glycosylase AlkD